ncbi:hypothetical protein ABE042_15990 [Viridibacillus arvi]|uniref:hypothetical protein n=2 Tax=Viridibacillus arvi TaxID=263475 RepID=UPI003D2C2DF5
MGIPHTRQPFIRLICQGSRKEFMMPTLKGTIIIQEMKGPNILYIDKTALAKYFIDFDGEEVQTNLHLQKSQSQEYRGTAEIFYFEGKDGYGGNKFANDFYIDDQDILELLEEHEGEIVELLVELI